MKKPAQGGLAGGVIEPHQAPGGVRDGGQRPAGHDHALSLFAAGHQVLVYPGGDVEAMRPFRDRDRLRFAGRRGYIRLALRAGVPIVPLVAAGAHATFIVLSDLPWLARALGVDRRFRLTVFPLALSVPWGLTLGPLPPYLPWPSRILIEALPAIHFPRTGEDAAADDAWVTACALAPKTAAAAARAPSPTTTSRTTSSCRPPATAWCARSPASPRRP